ncbi:MAG: VanZ family protein [Chloroflexi bacterium]|nr:VanZ family protein [Chloroflexota bacterium]
MWWRLAAVGAWAGLIFALSSMSEPPGAQGGEWRSQVGHLTVYAVLAWLSLRFATVRWPGAKRMALLAACWAFAVLYGISDEWHQSFVPGRDAAILDVALDAVGAALGLSVLPAAARAWRARTIA